MATAARQIHVRLEAIRHAAPMPSARTTRRDSAASVPVRTLAMDTNASGQVRLVTQTAPRFSLSELVDVLFSGSFTYRVDVINVLTTFAQLATA